MFDRSRNDAGGASAVEFALLLPVLIVLLFGTMYGASLFNSQQTVTQAAREAARFGATLPLENPTDAIELAAWATSIENRADGVLSADRPLTAGAVAVEVIFVEDGDARRVEVFVSRDAVLELGIASYPVTLTATGIARFEGE